MSPPSADTQVSTYHEWSDLLSLKGIYSPLLENMDRPNHSLVFSSTLVYYPIANSFLSFN